MRYVSMGDGPAQAPHAGPRRGRRRALLVEEVMGYEGFSGNESILYHLHSPCDVASVGAFEPIALEEWVPDAHVHRLTDTAPLRRVRRPGVRAARAHVQRRRRDRDLQARRASSTPSTATARATRCCSSTRARAPSRRSSARLPYAPHDYVVIPRGTTYRVRLRRRPADVADVPHARRDRDAQPLPQPLRPAARARAVLPARLPPAVPRCARTTSAASTSSSSARGAATSTSTLDYHPFDVVGWDGYVYPYTFNIADFEPKSGRLHQPPTVHQTFQGPNFVICSFCPRNLDWDPLAVAAALPPLQPAVRGAHLLRRRRVRLARGRRAGRADAAPQRPAARPAARPRRALARRHADRGARRHVRHVPPAAPDDARPRPRRPELRAELARGRGRDGRLRCTTPRQWFKTLDR